MEGGNMVDSKGPLPMDDGSSITIKVLFFARAHDLAGVPDVHFKVLSGSTTTDCLNELIACYPGLNEIPDCTVLALNEENASESAIVKENDELAIIPPINGGLNRIFRVD